MALTHPVVKYQLSLFSVTFPEALSSPVDFPRTCTSRKRPSQENICSEMGKRDKAGAVYFGLRRGTDVMFSRAVSVYKIWSPIISPESGQKLQSV